MKLWMIYDGRGKFRYEAFDSAIVAAATKADAKKIHPGDPGEGKKNHYGEDSWCDPKHVECDFIGNARRGTKRGVILASFNAA